MEVLLKKVRKDKGLSQNALARELGMSLNAVQHLEYKAKSIHLETLAKLCKVLDCQPGDLLVYVASENEANPQLVQHKN